MVLSRPDSSYAYRAKEMLVDMPSRYQTRYQVTEEELDLSRFAKSRPGTNLLSSKMSPKTEGLSFQAF